MSFSSLFGTLLAVGVVAAALLESGMPLEFFLNFHGLVIVICGTFAAASISFPLGKVFSLVKVFLLNVLGRKKVDYQGTINVFLDLNKKVTLGQTSLKEATTQIKNPFFREAVDLVASGLLNEEELREVLEQRVKTNEYRYNYEANMFRSIGRFPPAFGLLATTLGMIALLQSIGKPGSEKLIGPAMSIGLVGTFYGIGIANLIFLPIAENLTVRTEEEIGLQKMIVEGACMLKAQTHPIAMRENLNSFAPPNKRVIRKAS